MTYETQYQTLRRIAREMENPELPLDELVALLKEATEAYAACKIHLDAAQEALEALEDQAG